MAITTLILCIFAFLAGFIDSIAGGGGLIQLPALLIFIPSLPVVTILGTNKLISSTGTSMAVYQYTRRMVLNWRVLLPSALVAFIFSFLGARTVSLIRSDLLRPIIVILLAAVAVYIFLKRDFGTAPVVQRGHKAQLWIGMLAGAMIGFYDGFFGPGTGSFLIFVFVSFLGMDFLLASASAKIINLSTNLAAVSYFALSGNIHYLTALPMIAFNILGAMVGSRLAMLKGNRFVRSIFLVVVLAAILKLTYDVFMG